MGIAIVLAHSACRRPIDRFAARALGRWHNRFHSFTHAALFSQPIVSVVRKRASDLALRAFRMAAAAHREHDANNNHFMVSNLEKMEFPSSADRRARALHMNVTLFSPAEECVIHSDKVLVHVRAERQ